MVREGAVEPTLVHHGVVVNPHDIAWWYRWTAQTATERRRQDGSGHLPSNFETAVELITNHKPRLQISLQQTAATGFGPVSYSGDGGCGRGCRSWTCT